MPCGRRLSACGRNSRRRTSPQQPKYRRTIDQIASAQTHRIGHQPRQPLQAGVPHAHRRTPPGAGQKLQRRANAQSRSRRATGRGNGRRETLLPWRTDGQENEPRGMCHHEIDRRLECRRIVFETHRRVVVSGRDKAAPPHQDREVLGAQADNCDAFPRKHVSRQQRRGDVAAGRDAGRPQPQHPCNSCDNPRVEQSQRRVLIDRP